MLFASINLVITICFERKYHHITHTNQTSGKGTNGKKAEMHWLTIVLAENAQNYCQQENYSTTYAEKFVEMLPENMYFLEISTRLGKIEPSEWEIAIWSGCVAVAISKPRWVWDVLGDGQKNLPWLRDRNRNWALQVRALARPCKSGLHHAYPKTPYPKWIPLKKASDACRKFRIMC